jgi:hypothetical protein
MTQLNFQNSFWGPGDRGFPVLLNRMKKAKKTTEEVQLFLKERVLIEEEYARKLSKLAKNHLFNDEIGYFKLISTLGSTLQACREECEMNARTHLQLATEMKDKITKPLQEFQETQTQIRKTHQKNVEKITLTKQTLEQQQQTRKQKYISKTKEFLTFQNQIMTEKLVQKLDKLQQQQQTSEKEYKQTSERLIKAQNDWKLELQFCFQDYEKLEEERFTFTRTILWSFTNIISQACVLNDEVY